MRIQRLRDGILYIAASNSEDVKEVIVSAGTWAKVFVTTEELHKLKSEIQFLRELRKCNTGGQDDE